MFSEQRIYPNGLKLVVNQTDSQLACVLVRIETGVANELKMNEGITSVVEKLLVCGTAKYPSKNSLRSAIESFGGNLSIVTDIDSIKISIDCLPAHVEKAIEILSQIIFCSNFSNADLNGIKDELNRFRKSQGDSPFLLAYDNLREIMFSGSGLDKNVLGRKNSVNSISFEKVKKFWDKILCAQNLIISVCGNVEIDSAYEFVMEQFYGKLLATRGKKISDIPSIIENHSIRFVIDTKKLYQNRILVGYRTNGYTDKSHYALYLVKQILDSKLKSAFLKMDSVFSVGCFLNSFKNNGLFYARVAADDVGASDAVRKIAATIKELLTNGISNAEFVGQKEIFKTKFAQNIETSSKLARVSSKYTRYFDYTFDIDGELKKVDGLTQGDCLKALRKMLNDKPYVSIVGSSKLDERVYYDFYDMIKTID